MLQVYIKNIVLSLILIAVPVVANAAPAKDLFVAGQDYFLLPTAVRNDPDIAQLIVADPNKVQVVFFFSYGCHGCALFHAPFEKWASAQQKKYGGKIVVHRYPVSFNEQWKMLAKLYYTMEFLDPSGKLNDAIFDAINKKGVKLWQPEVMKKFFVEHGYKAKEFEQAFNSFGVDRQMRRADEISKSYKIAITPDIIINGATASYKLDLTKEDKSLDKFFRTLDYLVQREVKQLQ